ncbi:hypothetical protein [Kumtagia ephedrae]|uniref:Mll5186 protein n=1 Tax=Kumtagia ephedrae TaxID=2116701 RepID=A0A2P7S781_9HYPH|nr:hypothetical protein [Mesorhizobium ephedrae]PSJ58334.1 hypothetical protein C7I84_15315 [Mesorhizobium ephedrae]
MALAENPQVTPAALVTDDRSYVDWPAILAGTFLATAVSFVLLTFGSALGLSLTSAYEGEGISLTGFAIAAALWLLWVQISSFFAGGYLAGRLRRRFGDASELESDLRDGAHGLTVWALGVLISAFIAYSGISGAASTAASAVSAAGGAAATAVSGVAGAAGEALDQNELLLDRLLRPGTAAPAEGAAAPAAPAPDTAAPAPGAASPAPAPDAAARDTTGDRGEFTRILLSTIADGQMDDADRQYLVSTVAQRAGIPPEEAQQRVDQLAQQAAELEAQARAAADRARRLTMLAAFITAASLFVSAVAAYYAATLGGNHRDKQTFFADWARPW